MKSIYLSLSLKLAAFVMFVASGIHMVHVAVGQDILNAIAMTLLLLVLTLILPGEKS